MIANIPQLNLPWISSPFFEKILADSSLDQETKNLVQHYATYGYLIIEPEIENFDETSQQIIQNLEPHYQGNIRIQDAWKFNEYVRKIAIAPKVLSLLRILYQREPIPFQTLNFPVGTQQATHSDTIHFNSVPSQFMCGVWVALEDIDTDNGPLHYYPKSQKLPVFDLLDLGLDATGSKTVHENYAIYDQFIRYYIQYLGLSKIDITLRKGQAMIWSANLLHGGSPILDANRTRHSQVTHYFFSDCIYYTPLFTDPFLKNIHTKEITNIATGEIVPHVYNGQKINFMELVQEAPSNSHLEQLKTQVKSLKEALDNATHEMTSMSSSKFWKLRNKWISFKQTIRGSKGN